MDHFINKYEEMVNIAEVQYHHDGHNPSWYKDLKEYQAKVSVLKEVKETVLKAMEKAKPESNPWKVNVADIKSVGERLCWSNYRVVMAVDMNSHMVKALFWTPDLKDRDGIPVQNSHHDLAMCLSRMCDDDNDSKGSGLEWRLHWCGFYTFGYGNGEQEQLTLYGESSDYRHTKNSNLVKNAWLENKPFELGTTRSFWEMISGMPDEMIDEYVDELNR